MGLEEKKVNRVSRMVLNLMRLEVLLGIALILWTLNLAAQTSEQECPSTMEAILAEQEKAAADMDLKRMRFYTACRPKTVHEQAYDEEQERIAYEKWLSEAPARAAAERTRAAAERTAEIFDAKYKNDFRRVAKLYQRDFGKLRAGDISAPQATQLNTYLLTLYQQLLIEQNDKMLKQNAEIIELLEGMQSN
jgi:hypothetical protein